MLFTSLDFFVFLPLVLAVFALTPVAQRWAVLLLASYVFYGFTHPFNLIYLGAVTLVVFACGWGLERARQRPLRVAVFVMGLVAVLGSLTALPSARPGGLENRRYPADRDQRGLRGHCNRSHEGPRFVPRRRQCGGWRDCTWSPDRRERRGAHDASVAFDATRRDQQGDRHALHRGGQGIALALERVS